jgi:hypothetical protein
VNDLRKLVLIFAVALFISFGFSKVRAGPPSKPKVRVFRIYEDSSTTLHSGTLICDLDVDDGTADTCDPLSPGVTYSVEIQLAQTGGTYLFEWADWRDITNLIGSDGSVDLTKCYYAVDAETTTGLMDACSYSAGTITFDFSDGSPSPVDYIWYAVVFTLGSDATTATGTTSTGAIGGKTDTSDSIDVTVTVLDTTPPLWRNQGQNNSAPLEGEPVLLYAQGYDETALDFAILETNESGGVWQNKTTYGSPMDMGDAVATWEWSNFTWVNASVTAGTTVGWRIWYNDTSGNYNVTDVMTFTVQAIDLSFTLTYPSYGCVFNEGCTIEAQCPVCHRCYFTNDTPAPPWNEVPCQGQNGTVAFLNFTNTGNVAERWEIILNVTLPTGIIMFGDREADAATGDPLYPVYSINDSLAWVVNLSIAISQSDFAWMWSNISQQAAPGEYTVGANSTSYQA